MPLDSSAATHMRRALELAQLGWGHVHPNPLVGAVIVRDHAVVGEGYHARYGEAHAEVAALRAAGENARGATMYVTLEPCTHHGKTPPCTHAIIVAGVSTLVFAAADPNPRAGGGAEKLRQAGVEVFGGVEASVARAQNAAFFYLHERGAPYVALKLAMSLDGRIAEHAGARTQLTGAAANREVHRLRAGFDAILIGSNTALVDDPLLTVREYPQRKPPVRVVLDTEARLPLTSQLVQSVQLAPLWLVTAPDANAERTGALAAHGARVLHAPRTQHGIDVQTALRTLAENGVNTIFAEGGARLAGALLAAQAVQRMYLFITPRLLGDDGVPAFAGSITPASRWRLVEQRPFDQDVMMLLEPGEAH